MTARPHNAWIGRTGRSSHSSALTPLPRERSEESSAHVPKPQRDEHGGRRNSARFQPCPGLVALEMRNLLLFDFRMTASLVDKGSWQAKHCPCAHLSGGFPSCTRGEHPWSGASMFKKNQILKDATTVSAQAQCGGRGFLV